MSKKKIDKALWNTLVSQTADDYEAGLESAVRDAIDDAANRDVTRPRPAAEIARNATEDFLGDGQWLAHEWLAAGAPKSLPAFAEALLGELMARKGLGDLLAALSKE